jgi:hypothetical protein
MKNTSARSRLLDTFYKLMIIIAALGVATYAWLTNTTEFDVNQLSITTLAYTDIEMSLDNGVTWGSRLDIGIDENFAFENDVTGNGITLYKATLKDSDGYPITFATAIANEDYLDFDIMFRSVANVTIFLEKNSSIQPYAGTTEPLLIGSLVDRKSSFGDYSRDLIAGAVRVSFIEYDYTTEFVLNNNLKLTWAPNPSYHMIYDNGDYLADIDSLVVQDYDYINVVSGEFDSLIRHPYLKDNIKADHETKNAFGDFELTKMNTVINDYNTSKIKIRIWVEGNDRDAVVALKGGLFKIDLRFTGINKGTNLNTPSVTADDINFLINNYTTTMEHSIDYGNNWINYSENNSPVFEVGDVVWVRFFETPTTFASNHIVLNF